MRSVHVRVRVDGVDPATAFDRIKDFARYPDLLDVVRSVVVRRESEHVETSDWEVYFRNGILRWTEVDRFDHAACAIAFEQVDGDFAEFSGSWRITASGDGAEVAFAAEFDFGIPSLAGILDPVAARVFRETIAEVVVGLFERTEVLGDHADLPAVAATGVG